LDGLKTGHTIEAGYCFTGTAERNGMRLISVVMGAPTEEKRFVETRKLLDYGFNNFEIKTVITAKSELEDIKTVKVKKGVELEVPIVTQEGLEFVVKKGEWKDKLKIEAQPYSEDKLIAPIKKGDITGTVTVTYEDGSYKVENTVNLVAAQDVEKAGWFRLLFRSIGNFFGDMITGLKNIF
jgi:D-alanyl-D-alanine carboxypeptidase (penicillin-binding protein 5/6)